MDELQKKWDKAAELIEDDPMRPVRYAKSFRYLNSFNKDIKILEVGCGEGSGLSALKKLGYKNLYGVEVSPERIRRANKILSSDVELNIIDPLDPLPFKDNFFDVVISLAVIEHTVSPEEFLKEIRRVLQPNSFSIISSDCYTWRILQLLKIYRTHQPIDKAINPLKILKLFKSLGFNLMHMDTFNLPERGNVYFHFLKKIITKLLINNTNKKRVDKLSDQDLYQNFVKTMDRKNNFENFSKVDNIIRNYIDDENIFLLKIVK